MAMSRSAPIFEIYTDRKGEFRWRARARNGNLLAAASEGYAARRDAVHCAKLFGYEPAVVAPVPKKIAASKAVPAAKAVKKPAAKKLAAEAEAAPPKPRRVAKPKAPASA